MSYSFEELLKVIKFQQENLKSGRAKWYCCSNILGKEQKRLFFKVYFDHINYFVVEHQCDERGVISYVHRPLKLKELFGVLKKEDAEYLALNMGLFI